MIKREEDLYDLWIHFCLRGDQTADLRLRGINAGNLNRFSGPDFQGAEFELDGIVYRGDVEIHWCTNDWYNHHHHLDRNYDLVILHLVLDQSGQIFVNNSKMKEIVTLSFKQFPHHEKLKRLHCPSDKIIQGIETIRPLLKKLALKRLYKKEIRIRKSVEEVSYDQAIFQELMYLLGKPYNEQTFYLLASRLPWNQLMTLRDRYKMTPEVWLALFAMKSGLISVTPEFFPLKVFLERIGSIINTPGLAASLWYKAGQRPNNKPAHHIKILAFWLYSFEGESIYHKLRSKLYERLPHKLILNEIENIFGINESANKLGNAQERNISKVKQWGRMQVIEFIGNVIIPFFHWEAEHQSNFGFQMYLQSFYFSLPQSIPYAKLNPMYHHLTGTGLIFNKFYKNQGLMFLKDNYCDVNGCKACPIFNDHKEIDIYLENI